MRYKTNVTSIYILLFWHNGFLIVEVNECADNPCLPGNCINKPGSYVCSCPKGFQAVNGRCVCKFRNLLQTKELPRIHYHYNLAAVGCDRTVCPANSRCIMNERQEISCRCASGFRDNGKGACLGNVFRCCSPSRSPSVMNLSFSAVNECTNSGNNPCGPGDCIPQDYEGYDCVCPKGFQKTGFPAKCADVDECSLYNPCIVGDCVNTIGSYTCKCPSGYQFDSGHCVGKSFWLIKTFLMVLQLDRVFQMHITCCNLAETIRKNHYSEKHLFKKLSRNVAVTLCMIKVLSIVFQRIILSFNSHKVIFPIDINECLGPNQPCAPGNCRNLEGSYECYCPNGYQKKNGKCVGNYHSLAFSST